MKAKLIDSQKIKHFLIWGSWYETVRAAFWETPNEIKEFYSTVSILKNSRVVFNISGNKYRLVA